MRVADVLNHLSCEYDVDRPVSQGKMQCVAYKVWRGIHDSVIHPPVLRARKQVTVRFMATPNIEYCRALSADALERRLCCPLEDLAKDTCSADNLASKPGELSNGGFGDGPNWILWA